MSEVRHKVDLAGAFQASAFIAACVQISHAIKQRGCPDWHEWATLVRAARKEGVLGGLPEWDAVCRKYHESINPQTDERYTPREFYRAVREKCDEYRAADEHNVRSQSWRAVGK